MSGAESREKRISKGVCALKSHTGGLPGTTTLTTTHVGASTPTVGLGWPPMPMESQGITPGSAIQSRGMATAEASNIRSRTAHIPHLLLVKVMEDKDSRPSSIARTGVAKQPTPASRAEHLNRIRLDLPTSCCETLGAEFT